MENYNVNALVEESVSILELKKILDLHLVKDSEGGYEIIDGVRTESKIVSVTPELAKLLLMRNINNRPQIPSHINSLAKSMANGEWRYDAKPILFDKYGKLIDGQNRLSAVVKSGQTVKFKISYGFEPEIFSIIDIGKIRTGGDTLAVAGYDNPILYSMTANFIFRFFRGAIGEVGGYSKNKANSLTHNELLEFVRIKPEIKNSIDFFVKNKKNFKPSLVIPSVLTGLHFLFSEKDKDLADLFFTKMLAGDAPAGSPMLIVRNKLYSSKYDRTKRLTQGEMVKLIISGWNRFREGKNVKLIIIPENVPTIL